MPFCLVLGNEPQEMLLKEVPSSYKGRIRPLEATARLWLEDNYNRQNIKYSQYNEFRITNPSALMLLWKIQFTNHQHWMDIPLFWIHSARLKELLKLRAKENYFSYQQLFKVIYEQKDTNLALIKELITYQFVKNYYEGANRSRSDKMELQQLSNGLWVTTKRDQLLVAAAPKTFPWHNLYDGFVVFDHIYGLPVDYIKQHRALNEEIFRLLGALNEFSQLNGPYAASEKGYEESYQELIQRKVSPQQIAEFLEREFPLNQRLDNAGTIFRIIPGKNDKWYSLNTLTLHVYDKETNRLQPIENFTPYPDDQFDKIRNVYLQLIHNYESTNNKTALASLLLENYNSLVHKPMQKAWDKSLVYPSLEKLKVESWYYQLPLIETTIALYGVAIVFLIIGSNEKKRRFTQIGTFFVLVAFVLNTLILAIRCFIMSRPPVSTMFETVIYVPWIAVLTGLLLTTRIKSPIILLGSSLVALILLVLLKTAGLGGNMENVQAVLDSQFWLIIHVLMVVGSYGVFALAGILGQIYLFKYIIHEHETFEMQGFGKAILQALYLGVALLIPGTILGGVWAAQSWGRFWDWDPKESWAFISSCIYLIFIHAYNFKHIHYFGLAMGAVLGLLAISFTWYGVNYILATGLHSYGFGTGGEIYYYLFILAELLFLSCVGIFHLKLTTKSSNDA